MTVTPMIIQATVYPDTGNLYAYVHEGQLVVGQEFDFRSLKFKVKSIFGEDPMAQSYGRSLVGFMAQSKTDKEVFEIVNPGKKYEDQFCLIGLCIRNKNHKGPCSEVTP